VLSACLLKWFFSLFAGQLAQLCCGDALVAVPRQLWWWDFLLLAASVLALRQSSLVRERATSLEDDGLREAVKSVRSLASRFGSRLFHE